MKYRAKPVEVTAFRIVSVGDTPSVDGVVNLALDNGQNTTASAPMVALMQPKADDYYIVDADGYVYLNPKEVFEKKYESIEGDSQR